MFGFGSLKDALDKVSSGEMPEGRETIADCMTVVLAHLVVEFMRGDTPLGAELAHLVRAAQNPKDPSMKSMPMLMGMGVRTSLSQLEEKRAEFQKKLARIREEQRPPQEEKPNGEAQ